MPLNRFNGVVFPVDTMRVTLPFAAPYPSRYYSLSNPHKGLDVAPHPGSFGEPVRAPVAGKVAKVVNTQYGLGPHVVIETAFTWDWGAHDTSRIWHRVPAGEPFFLLLSHLRSINVKKGQTVAAGQQIGQVDMIGTGNGAHVHVELRIRDYAQRLVVNPDEFFAAHIVGYKQKRFFSSDKDKQFAESFTYGKAA